MNKWIGIDNLKQTSLELMDAYYTDEFVKKNKLGDTSLSDCGCTYICELIEVDVNPEGKIKARRSSIKERNPIISMKSREYKTSKGIFTINDHGEFGGFLKTPLGKIYGNFICVFEFESEVYFIRYKPMTIFTGIYRYTATEKFPLDLLGFSRPDCCSENYQLMYATDFGREGLELVSYFYSEDVAYMLLAGVRKSILLKLYNKEIIEVGSYNISFSSVANMIIKGNTMILGLDKIVAIVDINTGEITAYTLLSDEALEDVEKAKEIIENKKNP